MALSADIAADRRGLLMRIAINELDLGFDGTFRKDDPGDDDHERAYLMRMGVVRIVKLALQAHAQFDALTVTMRRDQTLLSPGPFFHCQGWNDRTWPTCRPEPGNARRQN